MEKDNWGIGLHEILLISVAILLSGSGSIAERIQFKFTGSPSLFAISFFISLVGIAIFSSVFSKKYNSNQSTNIIQISRKTRIVYVIVGTFFC